MQRKFKWKNENIIYVIKKPYTDQKTCTDGIFYYLCIVFFMVLDY